MDNNKPDNLTSGGKLGIGATLLTFFFFIAPPAINHYSAAFLNLVQSVDIILSWFY